MNNYSFNVFWSQEDQSYIATCPEFPTISAFGDTPEQALAEMQIALEMAIETYQEEGWPLPQPRTQPTYSGQFRVRMPKSLHSKLATQAEDEGISLNTLVVTYLSQAIGASLAVSKPKANTEAPVNTGIISGPTRRKHSA